jgi:hypothetical protein
VIKVGDIVPLVLQLADGSHKERAFVTVLDSDFKILFQDELTHVYAGAYKNMEFKMPASRFVTAQYIVTSTDRYEIVSEVFYSEPVEESFISGIVIDESDLNGGFINGYVS